jgi:transcriptional regulator with XRE-family HTH domain
LTEQAGQGQSRPRRSRSALDHLQPLRRRLVEALVEVRLSADLTGAQLASRCGWSQSKVGKIESGRTRPVPEDVEAWLDQCAVSVARRSEMLELADLVAAESQRWKDVNRDGFVTQQQQRRQNEAAATEIRVYQPKVVPGLFQTADYARDLLSQLGHGTSETLESDVAARIARQAALYDSTKRIDVVILEAVLRWRPGSVETLIGQLDRLVAVSMLPSVTLGIVPDDVQESAKTCHSFVLMHYEEDRAGVQVETLTREQTLTGVEDVAQYEEMFGYQRSIAVYGEDATAIIGRSVSYLRSL